MRLRAAAALVLGACALIVPLSLAAAMTERVVVDRYTGLAIGGIDPVSYFTDSHALRGSPDFEAVSSGAIWRFTKESNRAFFLANPEIYEPRFGGYDPVGVASGKAVAGVAQIWMIHGERLYLFGREETRDAFAADPAGYVREADRRWARLSETLAAE
ncbi:MAG: YHS domain-containing (seleno)protein [Pseudomonadota bacterium]